MTALAYSQSHLDEPLVLSELLSEFRIHLLARGEKEGTVNGTLIRIEAAARRMGYPWAWETAGYDRDRVNRRATGIKPNTERNEEAAIASLGRFLTDRNYRWYDVCLRLAHRPPVNVVTAANHLLHVERRESGESARGFTRDELRTLYAYLDDRARDRRLDNESRLVAAREGAHYKTQGAFGFRRREGALAERKHWVPNTYLPGYGEIGLLNILHGKSKARGAERQRFVYCIPLYDWIVEVLDQYLTDVWPHFRPGEVLLFPNTRGGPLHLSYISVRFAQLRAAAGLPDDLVLHSLRHAYITHCIEHEIPSPFVSLQVGHEHESSTALYTHFGDDFVRKMLLHAQAMLPL